MKIYTKTGDSGETGLFGGGRLSKDDPRIEAYGTVDELNAAMGLARALGLPAELDVIAADTQHELFNAGAELATPAGAAEKLARRGDCVGAAQIERLELAIDRLEARLAPLTEFILPGGTASASALHLARTICRRAERRVVSLGRAEPRAVSAELLVYLNRLGDLLFVMARAANAAVGSSDVVWRK